MMRGNVFIGWITHTLNNVKCHLLIFILKLFKLFQQEFSRQLLYYARLNCDFTSEFLVLTLTWHTYIFFDLFACFDLIAWESQEKHGTQKMYRKILVCAYCTIYIMLNLSWSTLQRYFASNHARHSQSIKVDTANQSVSIVDCYGFILATNHNQ